MRRRTRLAIGLTALAAACGATHATAGPPALTFRVVDLPNSHGGTEPSVAVDAQGRIFVSPIFGFGNTTRMNTPVWRSTDGGRTYRTFQTASAGPEKTPLGGGDSAVIVDKRGYVYSTDLWIGNDSIAVSKDHGETWFGGPVSHRVVGDRNWLAYAAKDDALYQIWNGVDGLYVARADLGGPAGVEAALGTEVSYRVAGENVGVPGQYTRAGSMWPGGIAVDQREGVVYASWSDQDGVAVAKSTDRGATWTIGHVPGTNVNGSLYDTAWNYAPVGVDAKGNVFVAWSQVSGSATSPDRISIYLGVSRDGGRTWRKQRLTTRQTAVFPTMAVMGVDRVALAWIDTTEPGNPNSRAFDGVPWRLAYGEVTGLAANRARTRYANVDPWVHGGPLFVGTQGSDGSGPARGMGDFISMAVAPNGQVVLVYSRQVGGTQPKAATLAPHKP